MKTLITFSKSGESGNLSLRKSIAGMFSTFPFVQNLVKCIILNSCQALVSSNPETVNHLEAEKIPGIIVL